MPTYRTIVQLRIDSYSITAEEITQIVGLKPHKSWNIGDDVNEKGIMKRKDNGWLLECEPELTNHYDADTALSQLIKKLDPYKDKIKSLSQNKKIESVMFYFIQYVSEDSNPQFFLRQPILEKIYDFGADIYMDIYIH